MCLGVPGRVVEITEPGRWAVVDMMGVSRRVGIALVAPVAPGEFVMVHAGTAIERLDPEQAAESLRAWEVVAGVGDAASLPGAGTGPAAP